MICNDITGRGHTPQDVRFGLGYNPDDFALRGRQFLENHHEIKGNILNTSMPARRRLDLEERAAAASRTSTAGPASSRANFWNSGKKRARPSSEDDVETWKPLLDQYQICAIMIETKSSPLTYRTLMQSPNWIPFYDDGRIVMFGRADAPGSDLAFFKTNRLDPELRAFRTTHPIRGAERPHRTRPRGSTTSFRIAPMAGCNRETTRLGDGSIWVIRVTLPLRRMIPHCPSRPAACSRSRTRGRRSAQSRRLGRLPHPQRGLPFSHDPGSRHDGRNPDQARESQPHSVDYSQPRKPDEPLSTTRDRPELRDPDHASPQRPDEPARAARAQPRPIPALYERERSGPRPRPASTVLDTSQPEDFAPEVRDQIQAAARRAQPADEATRR